MVKVGTLYRKAAAGLFEAAGEQRDAFLVRAGPRGAARGARSSASLRVRLVPLCENVGALARLPDLLEAFYLALERGSGRRGPARRPPPSAPRSIAREAIVRVFVAMSDTAEQSGKIATDSALALALAGREEAERRLAVHAQQRRRARARR